MLWGAITKSQGENRRNKQKNKVQPQPMPMHSSQYNGMPNEISTCHMARSPRKGPTLLGQDRKKKSGWEQITFNGAQKA